jgi:diguanylate cyclase (GGDEF)-like protein
VERIDRAVAQGSQERIALLLIDLDRFKEVNDTLGHPAGDELIREFSLRLSQHLRGSDSIGRLGGDEFAILLRELHGDDEVVAFCERILQSATTPFQVSGAKATVGVSIGIADATTAGVERSELMRRADIALYAAKRGGRNCYRHFTSELDTTIREHRIIEEELRAALATGMAAFQVLYQPQFENRTNEIQGVEALVRWEHPRLGAIRPAVFIPVAEESGMIGLLDEWVLRQACRDAAKWPKLNLAVNVSARSFQKPGLAERLMNIAREVSFELRRLEIELTEKVLFEREGNVADEIRILRAGGVRITLDDFGTGYSSLRELHSLTVDKVKIGRSFVQHLGQSVDSAAMVNAIIELGHALGLQVTAQGVETENQKDFLEAIGCDSVQGYLFSKAIPAWAIADRFGVTQKQDVA